MEKDVFSLYVTGSASTCQGGMVQQFNPTTESGCAQKENTIHDLDIFKTSNVYYGNCKLRQHTVLFLCIINSTFLLTNCLVTQFGTLILDLAKANQNCTQFHSLKMLEVFLENPSIEELIQGDSKLSYSGEILIHITIQITI